ncbi:MAG TPA: inositol monophosphatase family protein [Rubrobacteraceae bacterium]|nr:inositol monophosphatase family protein [Rubrobacteraceae bacterium]
MGRELEVAIAAAEAAGEVLRSGFGQQQEVRYKGETDLVTEADERAEQAIEEILRGAFPEYGILAEESGELAGEGEARWIVDPLDGTTNYAHELPIFAASVALERAGEVVVGVVYDPMAQEIYAAERGSGATLNGQPIEVSDTDELIQALLASSFSSDREDISASLDLFGKFADRTQGVRQLGASALDLCYVAAGRLDGCYERGFSAWDVAAGILILEEAGGRATDYQGDEFDLQSQEVVASNGPLQASLVSVTSGDLG